MFMPHHIAIRVTRCWPHTAHSNQPRTSGSTVCGRDIFGRNMRGRNTRSGAVFGMMANSDLFHRASFCQAFFCHEHVYASPHRDPRDLLLATRRSLKSAPNLRLYSLWQRHLWQKHEGQKNAVGGDVRDDGKQWLVSSSIFLPNIFLP